MPEFTVTGVHHTAINVRDFDRSLAFYRDTMGLTLIWELEASGRALAAASGLPEPRTRVALLAAGQQHVEIFQYLEPQGEDRTARPCDVAIIHIGFAVTDTFLRLNGIMITATPAKIWRFINGLFTKGKFEFAALEPWLRENTKRAS